MANEAETKRWNDDRWAASWPRRERLTESVSPYLLDAIGARPGQRVLDIGCGGGGLAISLAATVAPGGEVVGVDLSAPLLDLARSRAEEAGVAGLRFVQLDVQTGSLGAPPFDLAVSQFGVMFFDEPLAAFAAVRRTLAGDGRLVFACWQGVEHNPWHAGTTLRPFVSPPPLPPAGKSPVGPFALGDDEYVREILEGAGFTVGTVSSHETSVRAPASAVVDNALLPMMGVAPEREDEARAALDAHLDRFAAGGGTFDYPLAFRIYEARNDVA